MRQVIKEDFMDAVLLPNQLMVLKQAQIGGLEFLQGYTTKQTAKHLEPVDGDQDCQRASSDPKYRFKAPRPKAGN